MADGKNVDFMSNQKSNPKVDFYSKLDGRFSSLPYRAEDWEPRLIEKDEDDAFFINGNGKLFTGRKEPKDSLDHTWEVAVQLNRALCEEESAGKWDSSYEDSTRPNEKVMDVVLGEFQLKNNAIENDSNPTSNRRPNANRKNNNRFSIKDQTPVDSLQKYRVRPGARRQKELDKERDMRMEAAVGITSNQSWRDSTGMSQKVQNMSKKQKGCYDPIKTERKDTKKTK